MYICVLHTGCGIWLTNIRTELASVEMVVLSCYCVAIDRLYYVQNDEF